MVTIITISSWWVVLSLLSCGPCLSYGSVLFRGRLRLAFIPHD